MPRLSANLPDDETDAAREGTCAAWVGEQVLKGEYPDTLAMLDMVHENGWTVDRAMVDYIQGYVDTVRDCAGDGNIHVEHTLNNGWVAGAPDACITNDASNDVHIIDLKYGFDSTESYDNAQLLCYLVLVIESITGRISGEIKLSIYQPRLHHRDGIFRTVTGSFNEFKDMMWSLHESASATQDPAATGNPGTHCRYCPASGKCESLANSLYTVYDFLKSYSTASHQLSNEQLSQELDFLKEIEKMLKGRKDVIESTITAKINASEHVKNYGLETQQGKAKLNGDRLSILALTGVDPMTEKICTPAELIRRGANKEIVGKLSTRPTIKPKLTRFDDHHFNRMFNNKKEN